VGLFLPHCQAGTEPIFKGIFMPFESVWVRREFRHSGPQYRLIKQTLMRNKFVPSTTAACCLCFWTTYLFAVRILEISPRDR
jgi:hypothetical protein